MQGVGMWRQGVDTLPGLGNNPDCAFLQTTNLVNDHLSVSGHARSETINFKL